MVDRLRGMLELDAVVPVVLIAAALLLTLEPTMLGVTISERQIVLAFFRFLGIDTLVERTGRLRRIERQLEGLARKTGGPPPTAGQVLRARSSFDRMDALVGLDETTRSGSLIVQHYLTSTAAELAPLLWLHAESDEPWYGRYLAQCEACVTAARTWDGASG
jgi:hypothetical protein